MNVDLHSGFSHNGVGITVLKLKMHIFAKLLGQKTQTAYSRVRIL